MSDWPARPVNLAWPPGIYDSARVHVTQHCGGLSAFGESLGSLFSFSNRSRLPCSAHGPAPGANHTGTRLEALEQVAIWRQQGWCEVQELALARWGRPIQPTCKGATVRDYVWLSPEAAAMVQEVALEHETVVAYLAWNLVLEPQWTWPLPGEIPWAQVDVPSWRAQARCPNPFHAEPTIWFRQFAANFEASLAMSEPRRANCRPTARVVLALLRPFSAGQAFVPAARGRRS